MFFPELEKHDPDTNEFDLRCAKQLADAVQKNNKQMRPIKPAYWAKSFAVLRQTVEEADITQVLNWYCQNIKGVYTPKAYSGKAFLSKFQRIEEAMEREPKQVEISDLAKSIGEVITRNRKWQRIDELFECIQTSLTNYETFLSQLRDYEIRCTFMKPAEFANHIRIFRFSANHLNGRLPNPEEWVTQWMLNIHDIVSKFPNTNITKQAFTVTHKRFTQYGRDLAIAYCGDPNRWDKLLEQINVPT